jgi:pre-mRNA-splicing factor ISY1
MARNEEKAQLLLNRWTSMKHEFSKGVSERRPFLASECNDLAAAEKWRRQLVREITKKVSTIQNAGLGEHKIRDLNDQINKSIKTKGAWEHRIRELGGMNYASAGPRAYDADGRELTGSGGYKYFGAARNLPGVRELFEQQQPSAPKRTRHQMFKNIDPDYYGYRDEDDDVLLPLEAKAESESRRKIIEEHQALKKQRLMAELDRAGSAGGVFGQTNVVVDDEEEEDSDQLGDASSSSTLKALVVVPSQDDIQALILKRKKEALLSRYATTDLQAAESTAKELLNVKN